MFVAGNELLEVVNKDLDEAPFVACRIQVIPYPEQTEVIRRIRIIIIGFLCIVL